MILSADAIQLRMTRGDITVVPLFDLAAQLNGPSLSLHLGNEYTVMDRADIDVLDTAKLQSMRHTFRSVQLSEGESLTVHPGQFLLFSTLESVRLPKDLLARVYGLPSLRQLGLQVSNSGELINPGFHGQVPLQIVNANRVGIMLHEGMPICQMTFEEVSVSNSADQN